ncbi:MAG TPA: SO_0444 family Cu/Zn efflux transporter, partial [Phycisphaerae bacterium]|nr:SO_0444 family Cu/Zn efflux transporter [Phycisphaerae bacterium]
LGFLVAGVLSVLISPETVQRHLGGRGLGSVAKAAALGVPLPLCSCGVIPVSASLRRHGAGKGPTISFLISTPQTGVDSIMVTFGLLGGVFAVFRPIAAFISGVVGGSVVSLLEKEPKADRKQGENCREECCAPAARGKLYRMFAYGFGTLPQDIGRALLVGLALAALITAVTAKYKFSFATIVPQGIPQILVLMLAGIPVYVCATASVPLAYALILAGVSPGAAFAFLVTGPATNAATIATIWKVMGRRATLVYLATMAASAFLGGLLLDQLVADVQVVHAHGSHWMLPGYVKFTSAAVLLGVLALAVIRRRGPAAGAIGPATTLTIKGMTCDHCADSVRKALLACPGVEAVDVDLAGGKATVSGQGLDVAALRKAVETLGYAVTAPQGA